jgi:ABC-type polysaccharide/polyol phosphate transport system ATPase subunit
MIVGDPGTGKSCLLRLLSQKLATHLRRDKIEKKSRLARLFLYHKVND